MTENKDLTISELFKKLKLSKNGKLKRDAVIIFGKEPAKFYPNTLIKISRFRKDDADLKFQKTEDGNLIVLFQTDLNQLNYKFLKRSF